MNKLVTAIATGIVSVGLMGGIAAAQSTNDCPTGTIEDTGPGSTNTITCTTTEDTHVTCINDVYVVGENGQAASTGDASGTDNTTSGSVVTGDATNDNNQTVQVGASCGETAAAPTTPTPGTGGGEPTPATTTTTPQVTTTPVGAVEAGGGAGSRTSAGAVAGVITSASVVGLGAGLLAKRFLARAN